MTQLTRRGLLAGTAAVTAAVAIGPLAAGTPAHAATPAAGKQVPGIYRYKVGSFEITVVADGALTFPLPDAFVRNAKKEEVAGVLEAAYVPKGMVTVPFTPIVINTGSKLVLVDTGYGPGFRPTVGMVSANLAAAGIDPKAIDIVLLSHLHPDHSRGLKGDGGALLYPNAEIMLPEPEWAFWADAGNESRAQGFMADYFKGFHATFDDLKNKVTKYQAGKEVVPGITSIATHGHTPGHMSFAVQSGSARMLVQSDVTNIPALFARRPEWQVLFDIDGKQAEATRRKFYDMASAEKALIQGFHFPFPGTGYIEKDGNGYRLVPAPWNYSL